jgi:excisionase family DNA binding protein
MSEPRKPVGRSLPDNSVDIHHQQIAAERASAGLVGEGEPIHPSSLGIVLDLREAAAILHCHPKTLRLMAQANKIPARRVGKLWRFSEHRLREWLEAS